MKFKTTKGKEISIDVRPSNYPMRSEEECKSKCQYNIGQVLRGVFPSDIILEEFYVPAEGIYIDFFIPRIKLAVEINGAQHDKYTPFFHGTKTGFTEAKNRDKKKAEWCRLNDIIQLTLPWDCPLDAAKDLFIEGQRATRNRPVDRTRR